MKITATNGNSRNGIKGQRVTFTARGGQAAHSVTLSTGNALQRGKSRAVLLPVAQVLLFQEAKQRFEPKTPEAVRLLALFAECKARLMIDHGRREIGHYA